MTDTRNPYEDDDVKNPYEDDDVKDPYEEDVTPKEEEPVTPKPAPRKTTRTTRKAK